MLVTVNKTKFSLSKTLRTLSNILDMECAVIRLSLHHEKHLFACSLVCPLTFAIIIFSEVHAIHGQSVQICCREERKKKIMAIAKLFELRANAIRC